MTSNTQDNLIKTEENAVETSSHTKKNEKRRDYLAWDDYFMGLILLESRSVSENVADAAITVNNHKVIVNMATGNTKEDPNESNVNHAEHKVLSKNQEVVAMYVTTFPCVKCAKAIVDSGIVELIYYQDRANGDDARKVLKQGGVTYKQFVSSREFIEIDFSQFYDESS